MDVDERRDRRQPERRVAADPHLRVAEIVLPLVVQAVGADADVEVGRHARGELHARPEGAGTRRDRDVLGTPGLRAEHGEDA